MCVLERGIQPAFSDKCPVQVNPVSITETFNMRHMPAGGLPRCAGQVLESSYSFESSLQAARRGSITWWFRSVVKRSDADPRTMSTASREAECDVEQDTLTQQTDPMTW